MEVFPCTLLQERLCREVNGPTPQRLNVALRWRVTGRLSHSTAERALQSLIDRYEILRTGFSEVDGRVAQCVSPAMPFRLREIDLSVLPSEQRDDRANEIGRAEAMQPFDVRQPPLLRGALLRLGPDRDVLLLTFHALVADGWASGILLREFRYAALAIEAGKVPFDAPPELQFADYALWEQELLASDALDESREFWRRRLREIHPTRVPADPGATSRQGERAFIESLLFPAPLWSAAEKYAREHNVTLYAMATASLALMLHRTTGSPDIVLGSQVANREDPATESLVGPTINSITLRLPVEDSSDCSRFVANVAETVTDALQHERLPFEIAADLASPPVEGPLHAINLVVHRSYSGTKETEQDQPGPFNLVFLPSFSPGPLWELNFFLIGRDEGWRLSCEADTGLYEQQTVKNLLQAWLDCFAFLAGASGNASQPARRAPIVPAAKAIPSSHGPSASSVSQPAKAWQSLNSTALLPIETIPIHDPARQVVQFHETAHQTPMVVLNNRSVYYPLAEELGENRPFIDIQLYHPDGPLDLPPHAFEVFGAYAVKLIRWARPHGPYILGGHCVYGVVAFEAARQLTQLGEKVELVTLFDSWAPGYREDMSPRDQKIRKRHLQLYGYRQRLAQYRAGEIGLNELLRKPLLRRLHLLKPEPPSEMEPGQWFDDAVRQAAARYRPRPPYGGDVVLFRSDEPLRGRLFDELMGWQPLISGNLTKVDVASAHLDMFRKQPAATIAAAVNDLLDARRNSGQRGPAA